MNYSHPDEDSRIMVLETIDGRVMAVLTPAMADKSVSIWENMEGDFRRLIEQDDAVFSEFESFAVEPKFFSGLWQVRR